MATNPQGTPSVVESAEDAGLLSLIRKRAVDQRREKEARFAEGRPWRAYLHAANVIDSLGDDAEPLIEEATTLILTLQERIETLEQAIGKFGSHKSGCNIARALPFERRRGGLVCSCGFDAARFTLSPEGEGN
jgi:hypothetical protein